MTNLQGRHALVLDHLNDCGERQRLLRASKETTNYLLFLSLDHNLRSYPAFFRSQQSSLCASFKSRPLDGFDGSGEHLFLLIRWQEQMDPLGLYLMAAQLSSERADVGSHCVRAGHPNASDVLERLMTLYRKPFSDLLSICISVPDC